MIETIKEFLSENGRTGICSLGQAGFLIKNKNGKVMAIDPYLSNCVEALEGHMGYRRLLPQIVMPEELELDFIVATHPHQDHYDKDSMPVLLSHGKTKLYASVNCDTYVKEQGISSDRVRYVKPGDFISEDGFDVYFSNCDHGEGAPDAVGVVVLTDGKVICETGDTCLRTDYKEEYLKFGKPDVLVAPINGAYGNMNETDCMKLASVVNPKVTVPCHYGMFASHGGDIGKFYELMQKEKLGLRIMAQGEAFYLS